MAASVNLPPAEPLPARPNARAIAASLRWAIESEGLPGAVPLLAAEVLHLRAELEAKGGELGALTAQAQEVTRAWRAAVERFPHARTDAGVLFQSLWAELDELAEIGGAV